MKTSVKRAALRAAFPYTVPILTGFLFLGISCGFLARASGLPVWFPLITSLFIFAGSMEFVTVTLLTAAFHPLGALSLTLMINARHLFYGISMLERYRGLGSRTPYLIFGMCDESFSINCAVTPPKDIDRGWFMFFVTLLNHAYWIIGNTIGSLLGSLFRFPTEGIDFVMTAMFVVILIEQWQKESSHTSSLLGLGITLLCLIVFGADHFLLPAMGILLVILLILGHHRRWEGGERT
ncbi:MAG: branched-chain amino acid transporter AzlC [Ruminococcaceae bacterium]|nr:branched-chain amino acid transporter AzlC [Oscillospiraceae bacterium]